MKVAWITFKTTDNLIMLKKNQFYNYLEPQSIAWVWLKDLMELVEVLVN